MNEIDELLSRLRKLEPIALDHSFKDSVRERARARIRRTARPAPLASVLVFGTALIYLGWALRFTSSLYP